MNDLSAILPPAQTHREFSSRVRQGQRQIRPLRLLQDAHISTLGPYGPSSCDEPLIAIGAILNDVAE